MKRVFVKAVLAIAFVGLAQGILAGSPQSGAADTPKVIKDPAEYKTYISALNTTDPSQKASAMEAFLKQYPDSVVNVDALEQAMAAYQQTGNQGQVADTASRVLQLSPNNIRALAIAAFLKRAAGTPQTAAEGRALAVRGIAALPKWQKPAGMNDDAFDGQRKQMTVIFGGACGFGALQAKDYPAARDCYLMSLEVEPTNLSDVYQLGIAELEMNPQDSHGFWYIAKAVSLAHGNEAAQKQIATYGRSKYKRYHGADDGWDELLKETAHETAPPAEFSVKAAPTPSEVAVNAVQQNDPATLSFSDWEYVLSYRDSSPANREAATKVWAAIQDKQKQGAAKLKIPVKVISATMENIDAAITDENQKANKVDVRVTMEKSMPRPPAVGSMIDVIGRISEYTSNPFMFSMKDGEMSASNASPEPTPPPKKKPAY
jgi:tetratricopeptide (TPR) repeat protein